MTSLNMILESIPFSSTDPFPSLEMDSYTYLAAKQHAISVDDHFGFKLESPLDENPSLEIQQTWQHLDAQAYQTPYVEIRSILEFIEPTSEQVIVDLGCAYGRMALVVGRHFPMVQFIGLELLSPRVDEGRRILSQFSFPNVELKQFDLFENLPPEASIYFIYDFGSQAVIEKTLTDLKTIATKYPIIVIARGRGTRALVHQNHPWLCEVNSPKHFNNISIYWS